MEQKITPLKYLITMLHDQGDFLREYKTLDKNGQDELKQWAEEEMEHKLKKGKENE